MNRSRTKEYLAEGRRDFLSINSLSSDSNIFLTDNDQKHRRVSISLSRPKNIESDNRVLQNFGIKSIFEKNRNKIFGNRKFNLNKDISNKSLQFANNKAINYTILYKSSSRNKTKSSILSNPKSIYSNKSESREKISSKFQYSFGKYLNNKIKNKMNM
jgi:hypothetical protein